jgi:autotransporter-associated beta strand protein
MNKKILLILSIFILKIELQSQTTYDWNSSAPDGNWKQGAGGTRWWPGGLWDEPPSSSATWLRFNNDNNTSMTNNVGAGYIVNRITLGSSATASRTIGGNEIQFYEYGSTWPLIINNVPGGNTTLTINFPIKASTNTGFNLELDADNSPLVFGSNATITNNGRTIHIYGNNTAISASNRSVTLTGTISGSGHLNITQCGVAKLNGAHTYTGETQIDNGELWIQSGGSISSSSSIYLGNGGLLDKVAKFWLQKTDGGITLSNVITVNNGNADNRTLGGLNSSGTNTFSGNITNNSSGGLILNALNAGGSVAFSGLISGSNPLITAGSGTVILSGTNANTYSGSTTISATTTVLNKSADLKAIPSSTTISTGSTLRTDATNQWGTGTPPLVTIEGTGTLNLNSNNQKIALASSSSSAAVTLGSATLNIDNTGTDVFAGIISGTGTVTKTGAGTQTLSGSNTYSGGTTLSVGKLNLNHNNAAGTGTLTLSGGTLDVDAARTITNAMSIGGNFTYTGTNSLTQTTGGITLTTSPTVTVSANTLSLGGIISGSYGLTKSGSGILTLGGANTYTGTTTISTGTLKLDATSSSSSSGPLGTTDAGTTVSSGGVLDLNGNSLSGSATEALTLNGDGISHGGALINLSSTPCEFTGAITLGTGSRVNATTGNITLSGNISGGSNSLYVGGSNNTSISGIISGAGGGTDGSLFKDGSGTLTLSGANDFTGDTRINAGNLTVNSGGSLGNGSDVFISSGANININTNTTVASIQETANSNGGVVAIGNGATLTINGSNKGTMFQNSISGQGGLTMAGSGNSMLSLYGSQTYTGATTLSGGALDIPVGTATSGVTVSGGNLYIKNNGALGSGTLTLSGGTLDVDAARAITNAISLGGNFTFTGTNSLTQTSGGITLTATPTITVSASTLSLGGAIGGSFGITKSGSGTLALAGVNTYTGLTTVSAGTLHINASGGCIPSANDIAVSGGTLHVSYDQIIDDLTATSGTITIDAGKTLTVNGKLSISNGVTINLNSTGKIAYGPNADLEFTGSATISDAVWPATGGPTDIIVNGSGITVTLDKSRTISGNMTLTSGVVTLGNYDLTVTGSLTGGGATAYINTGGTGKLIRSIATATQVTYPVGNVAYSPITLNFASGTFSSATASVKVATGKHPSNIAASSFINRYWEVNQTGISSFSCNVSCTYQQSDVSGTESDIYAGKYSGTTWTPGSAADVNNNILLFNNATSFSDFTGGELSAMPVSWLFFNCKPDKNHINLTWGVSEEPATGIYTIERSGDGRNWETIGTKTPFGQSFTSTSYHFADLRPLLQAYYRIKHTENLNEIQYSEMCFAQMKPEEKPKIKMDVTNNQIIVSLPTLSENTSTISLYDLCGRKLKSIQATKTHGHITTSDLPSGIYELIIEHPGYRHAEKILIFN